MRTLANYIDGRLVPPAGGEYLDNVEPATGRVSDRVPGSDERDVDAAVRAAQRAFPAWSRTPASERSRVLLRLADLVDEKREMLALAESSDTGKPLWLARQVDIPRASANLRFFATAILHAEGQAFEGHDGAGASLLNYTRREARGVAGLISPWNLPLYLLTWKIAPALATGNTAVAKPSELTPVTAFLLGELAMAAGLAPGVLNIVHGTGPKAGAPLVAHPMVPAISFTGGTGTGRALSAVAAPMFKRLSLELGGKNPAIVFEDADLDATVEALVNACFRNQGQICLCASRLLVQRRVFDAFLERLVARVRALRVGDPLEPETQQGALISAAHRAKVGAAVDAARAQGATVHCGGREVPGPELPPRCAGGFFYQPTVLGGLDPGCRVEQEEIFGPVVSVTPFDDEEEALRIANGTQYGLACTIWTRDLARAHRVAAGVACGIAWVNCWMVRDLRTPFGGMRASGVGREGGTEALRFFTEPKNVCVRF